MHEIKQRLLKIQSKKVASLEEIGNFKQFEKEIIHKNTEKGKVKKEEKYRKNVAGRSNSSDEENNFILHQVPC